MHKCPIIFILLETWIQNFPGKKNFHRHEKKDAEMSLLFTQSSYNGEIKAERIDDRLPAWLDHPSALIFLGDLVAGGRPNCEMKAKFTGN